MKITLLAIGKTDAAYLKEGINEFVKRLKHYIPFEFVIIPDKKQHKNYPVELQKKKEGELLASKINNGATVVLLDERGKNFSSREFASFIEKKSIAGVKEVVFIIGGAYGFSEEMYKMAGQAISLSKMTFSHQMVRLLFLEQLYRAFTIIKGEPYHND